MRIFYAIIFFITLNKSFADETKNMGIGLRIGDFSGLSFKYNFKNEKSGFEINFGRSFFWNDNYTMRFKNYASSNNISYIELQEVFEKNSIAMRAQYQIFMPIHKIPQLQWLMGIGFQVRSATFDYLYTYEIILKDSDKSKISTNYITNARDFNFGLDFVFGSEYRFKEFPLSVFADANIFSEIFYLKFRTLWQLGLGTRYYF